MKKLLTTLFLSFVGIYYVSAQNYTFSDDIAPVMYENCTNCHYQGGIGPFQLMTYSDVDSHSGPIYDAIAQNRMPPWPPNDDYVDYAHSRALEPFEKQMFLDWLLDGMPEGNPANTPAPPVIDPSSILGDGDVEVQMPVYESKAVNEDDYICISLPSELTEDRTIKAMEVVPGNREILHHCLVYIDEDGTYETDTTSGQCAGPTSGNLVGGYTPGSTPIVFPNGEALKLGMNIKAGSNIILAMHYPAGSVGDKDSTKVIFHFYDESETSVREVYAAPVLQNWNFTIPPNEVSNVNATSNDVFADMSVLSVFPHMHLLGKYVKSYALDPQQDTIRFIEIPKWNFHWQDFYIFKNLVKVPQNSTLYAEGIFDNTVNNHHNPNNPPVTVYPGTNTTDEMFIVYFHFLPYQSGDENHDLEDLTNLLNIQNLNEKKEKHIKIYPNPFSSSTNIEVTGKQGENNVSIAVYDYSGKLVKTLARGKSFSNKFKIEWDGNNDNNMPVSKGVYQISILLNGEISSRRIVK